MLVEGLIIEVRADTGIDVLTGVMVDVDMLAAVVTDLEFSVLISDVLDVVAGVIICCVTDIGVGVLTDINMFFLTTPSEGAIPSC